MIRQPWGCVLAVVCGALGVGLAGALGWTVSRWTGISPVTGIVTCCVVFGPVLFVTIMDAGQKIEIRCFCRRHGLKIVRIRTYRNCFGVDLIEDGTKKYKRWPQEFKEYAKTSQPTESEGLR